MLRQQLTRPIVAQVTLTLEQLAAAYQQSVDLLLVHDRRPFTASVVLPPGIEHRSRAVFSKAGPDGEPVHVRFSLAAHETFEYRNGVLRRDQPVSVLVLLVGGTVTVQDLLGRQYQVTIQPNTEPHTCLRIPGAGINGGPLHITLVPVLPKSLTPKLRAAILSEISNPEDHNATKPRD